MKRPGNKTAAELAKRLGISVRTVRRHVAQPRDEYEANSAERTRP
ncbi:helix-turn-helix domain-containing protein, partial [Burkholderia vietnamiensis]|nr:helix-turn-helix domain-containing protein [Burkholderia vietnamiensis]